MTVVTALPHGRPLSRADLDAMPEDGHRYELVDGVLTVSPSPSRRHQRAVGRLFRLLDDTVPDDLEVLLERFDVVLADDTVLIPDIVVARRSDLTERDLPASPVLAVEVLSPSSRRFDLVLKKSRLEAAGTPTYWVVNPDEPALTAWELRGGHYVEVAHATDSQAYSASVPCAVTVVPAQLVADRPS